MSEFPALPLWVDAYLADTLHLNDAEHGRYLRLLMLMWRSPDCRIPNDDEWIARKFARSVDDVRKQLRPLIAEFCQSDGNWLTQKRLAKEHAYVRKNAKRQSVRSKSRWNKEKGLSHGNADTHPPGNADTHPPGNAPTPTPKPKEEAPPKPPHKNGANGQMPPLGSIAWTVGGLDADKPDSMHLAWSFHKGREKFFGISPPAWIKPDEISICQGWIERGHSYETCLDMIRGAMKRRSDEGKPAPGSVKFFGEGP